MRSKNALLLYRHQTAQEKRKRRQTMVALASPAALLRRSGCRSRNPDIQDGSGLYRQLFVHSPDAYLLMDNGFFIDCNDAALAMLQANRDQVIAHSADHFSPEHQPDGTCSADSAAARSREAMEQGSTRFEWLHRALDGTDIWTDVTLTRMETEGRATLLAAIRDITDRKQAERITAIRLDLIEFAARHSLDELLTRSLDVIGELVGSPIGFYHFVEADQKTISLQQWSTATLERFCRTESKGVHYGIDQAGVWVDCVHARKAVVHNDYRALPGKKGLPPGHAEVVRQLVVPVLRDGKIVAILGVGNKPTNYSEQDVKAVSFIADVTWEIVERKRVKEKLQAEEICLRAITDSAQEAILMITPQGAISFWNPAAERFFGYSAEEAIGQNLHALITPPRYRATFAKAFPLFCQTGQGGAIGKTVELHALRKDGWEIPVKLSLSAVQLQDGWHAVGILRDITERKLAEQKLCETNTALLRQTEVAKEMAARSEMASIAKSEFLANMSHEIRTPMNGVMGMTELLLDTELNPEQRHYVEVVRASGESLLGLINDILDFSKIEAGQLDLELLDFDLAGLLEDFADTMAVRAHDKGLELLCDIDPATPTVLQGDPGRLRQVLTNLTGNAIKFTDTGEVVVHVALASETVTSAILEFTVRDTGIGIPADKTGLLFDKFSQVDASTTRRYGGTGLGLAISKQLVRLMDGGIDFVSEPGKGSVFRFTVQLGKQIEARTRAPLRTDLRGVRVLVVDDNATNREILLTRLGSWGMRPTEAPSGLVALAALRQAVDDEDPFAIAVIDMQMPDMDGETLGRIIHADTRLTDTRMVMLTSLGTRGDCRRFAEIGFSGYLTKPIRLQELKGALALAYFSPAETVSTPQPIVTRHTIRENQNVFPVNTARVLLVEDNRTNQQVALGILKKLGLKADAVANGEEAVKAVALIPYDLVLMDVQMPVMDGFEATRRIRRQQAAHQTPAIPIIAMTAHAMRGDKEKCLAAGMNDYLSKPVVAQVVIEMLMRWLPQETNCSSDTEDQMPSPSEQATAGAATPVWDKAAMIARLMDDEDLARTIAAGFLEDIPRQVEALSSALHNGDIAASERLTHTILGAAANVGGENLRAVAAAMEHAAAAGDLNEVSAGLPRMKAAFAQLVEVMALFCHEKRSE